MNHSVIFFFLLEKVSVWQPVTLHITSAWHLFPGCHGNVVAMRSIYLEIWRLQMSLGAVLNNKASVKLQTVKAHTHFLFWPRLTDKILIKTENVSQVSDSLDIIVSSVHHSLLHLSSSDQSVRKYQTKGTLWSIQYSRWIPYASQDQSAAWHTVSPLHLTHLSHPPPLLSLSAVQYSEAPCVTHVSASLTCGSVQKWEYHLLPFQTLISLSSI